jgi:UDP-N-acetylglucosamine 2-epimerase
MPGLSIRKPLRSSRKLKEAREPEEGPSGRRLEEFGLLGKITAARDIRATEPLSYLEFMNLVIKSTTAITDSGGVQEEMTYLGIPCATLRENTGEHRASHHAQRRHQPAAAACRAGRGRSRGARRGMAEGPQARALGRPHGAAPGTQSLRRLLGA